MELRKILTVVVSALMLFSAIGCGSHHSSGSMTIREETNESIDQFFVKGKTTVAQVESKFGAPDRVHEESGYLFWIYNFFSMVARPTPEVLLAAIPGVAIPATIIGSTVPVGTTKAGNLTVRFKNNIVEDYDFFRLDQ